MEHYQVPRFGISIQSPSFITDYTIDNNVIIRAAYVFGETNLDAQVAINYTVIGIDDFSEIRIVFHLLEAGNETGNEKY